MKKVDLNKVGNNARHLVFDPLNHYYAVICLQITIQNGHHAKIVIVQTQNHSNYIDFVLSCLFLSCLESLIFLRVIPYICPDFKPQMTGLGVVWLVPVVLNR